MVTDVLRCLGLSLCAGLLSSCTIGPDFKSPENAYLPQGFTSHGVSTTRREPLDDRWWKSFGDPMLDTLVNRLIDENIDIGLAETRLAQSRAQAGIAAADLYPQVNGNASFTRQQPSQNGVISLISGGTAGGSPQTQSNGLGGRQGGTPAGIGKPFNLWQNGFDASWELDFWGRVRRRVEAAEANVDASLSAERMAQVSMIAELVRDYVQLRGTQAMIGITRANLATTEQNAKLTSDRFKGGLGNELDFQNASAQVETIRSQIGPLEQREGESINQIDFLLGDIPGASRSLLMRRKGIPIPRGALPVGLPAELVRRRPDVQQAEAQLRAAVAEIGAAEADFFPRVTLVGSAGLQSLKIEDLYSLRSGTYSFGPAVTLPIFQGGRLVRTVELRTAQEQEASLNYRKAVIQALHDVDSALISLRAERNRQAALSRAVERNKAALDLANKRYLDGVATFLDVLTTQSNLLQTQQQLTDSRMNVGTNIVRLYKALGGGWENSRRDRQALKLAEQTERAASVEPVGVEAAQAP